MGSGVSTIIRVDKKKLKQLTQDIQNKPNQLPLLEVKKKKLLLKEKKLVCFNQESGQLKIEQDAADQEVSSKRQLRCYVEQPLSLDQQNRVNKAMFGINFLANKIAVLPHDELLDSFHQNHLTHLSEISRRERPQKLEQVRILGYERFDEYAAPEDRTPILKNSFNLFEKAVNVTSFTLYCLTKMLNKNQNQILKLIQIIKVDAMIFQKFYQLSYLQKKALVQNYFNPRKKLLISCHTKKSIKVPEKFMRVSKLIEQTIQKEDQIMSQYNAQSLAQIIQIAKEIIKNGHYSYLKNMNLIGTGSKIRPKTGLEEMSQSEHRIQLLQALSETDFIFSYFVKSQRAAVTTNRQYTFLNIQNGKGRNLMAILHQLYHISLGRLDSMSDEWIWFQQTFFISQNIAKLVLKEQFKLQELLIPENWQNDKAFTIIYKAALEKINASSQIKKKTKDVKSRIMDMSFDDDFIDGNQFEMNEVFSQNILDQALEEKKQRKLDSIILKIVDAENQ